MSKMADLMYDIEQLYIDGLSAKSIARILECPIETVLAALEEMGVDDVAEMPHGKEFDPFNTVNS